ncbi:MAG: glycosyltransferase family 2 protein [Candidatus Omnitrophica bacterium]|nr:glycosyltransferase family 2 protein [Candidatus Omnitrophota bacterium]
MISVVIPTHDRPALLTRAVQSVQAQTFRDLEILVVDDASVCPAEEVLAGVSDPRLKVLRSARGIGASAARNMGWRAARGEFIAFLDDDDAFLPVFLEKLLLKMQGAPVSVGVVYGGIKFLDDQGAVIRESIPRYRGNIYKKFLRGEKDANIMVLVRRACLERVNGFDESLKSCQDWDLLLRLSVLYDVECVMDILGVCYCHGGQLSGDISTLIAGRTRMVEKHRAAFAEDSSVLCIHLKRLGKMHIINGTHEEAFRWFHEAAVLNPLEWVKIGAWLAVHYVGEWFNKYIWMVKK